MNIQEQGAFRALADPTRRQILMHLSGADMTIGEISGRFDITRGAIKKHLTILEEGSLISVRISGRERINSLEPLGLKSVFDWLTYFDQFWNDKLGALRAAVESSTPKNKENEND